MAEGWTVREAAARLEPLIPFRTLDLWARMLLEPIGVRRTGKPGRPPFEYDKDELRAIHADLTGVTNDTRA